MKESQFDHSSFQKNLGEVTLLVFLRLYLDERSLYNNNIIGIAQVLKTFFMERVKGKQSAGPAAYNIDQVIKGLNSDITQDWESISDEQEQAIQKQLIELDVLGELIQQQYGVQVLNAITDHTDDTLLNSLAENIYDTHRKDALLRHAKNYRDKYAALQGYRERKAFIAASQKRQKAENEQAVSWARKNLRHVDLLCSKLKNKGYNQLLNPTDNTPTVEDLAALIAQPNKTIDDRLFSLINQMSAQAGAFAFCSLTVDGKLSKKPRLTPQERIIVTTLAAIVGTLIVGFILTNLLTFMPLIPAVAEQGLNHLYTTVFSAVGFVGPHHQFSFGAIYGMSVGFLAAIDMMIGYAAYRFDKKMVDIDKNSRTTRYPQKMANEICQYIDRRSEEMDDSINMQRGCLPTATLLINYNNKLSQAAERSEVSEPAAVQNKSTRSFQSSCAI